MQQFLDFALHLDTFLLNFIAIYGSWAYLALFLIIFCETGLVITPFLPGDSLLFVAGSIAAQSNAPLAIWPLFILLLIASILGNQVNFLLGRIVGLRFFKGERAWLLNKKHLEDTHRFYERHGGKTIIFARFLPIIRSFAPFVAGIGDMSHQRFTLYNVSSALLWIGSLLACGYFLGSLPWIKNHFSLVIYGIILISLTPPLISFLFHKLGTCRIAKSESL